MQAQPDVRSQPGTDANAQTSVPRTSDSIVPGADVFGMDGKKVGTVHEVYNDSILVQKGTFFPHDYYIPHHYVGRATDDEVNLTLTSDQAQRQNWDQRPGASPGMQTTPDHGTLQENLGLSEERTPPYGSYGRAGSSDTMQDATNRGLQNNQGTHHDDFSGLGSPQPSSADYDQWESDA
jgi:hypothetical protein